MGDTRINKLPKWARAEIETLQMRLREAEVQLSFAMKPIQEGFVGAAIRVPRASAALGTEEVMLPSNRISFYLPEEIFVDIRQGKLHVNGIPNLAILPRAANDFEVKAI